MNDKNPVNLIKADGLYYSYTSSDENGDTVEFQALKGVDMEVFAGRFVAVLGHNGSGKSTLAKNMNALLLPTSGTLWVKGYDTSDEDHLWDIRQNVGYVFQNPDNQIISAVVEEDIAFGPENLGVAPDEIRKRVDASLDAVGMGEYALHSPTHLSGGQKQRIAIAGVLAMKPDCIVLDEPTAMLDPSGRKEVIKTVRRLNREEGITVILITHYMEEAVEADIVFVMDKGEVVMQGTPMEIFADVDTVKSYGLDVPQVTEVAHRLKKRGFELDNVLHVDEMVGELCRLKSRI